MIWPSCWVLASMRDLTSGSRKGLGVLCLGLLCCLAAPRVTRGDSPGGKATGRDAAVKDGRDAPAMLAGTWISDLDMEPYLNLEMKL